jgi:apolipoprotein N-acyltransferase
VRTRVLWPTRAEAIPALASAALFALAFPPFRLAVPAFICLVPLAVAIATLADSEAGVMSGARVGFWFGLVGYGLNLYWIAVALLLFTKLAIAGYIASVIWLAPFIGGAAASLYAARRITRWRMAVLLPIVWVAFEVVLNYLSDLSFPWLPLGLSVSPFPMMAQIADLSGVRGVSLWIAVTNGLLADAWMLRKNRRAVAVRIGAVAGLAAGVAGYGAWRMSTTVLRALPQVAVIQPNIPEDEKLRGRDKDVFVGALAAETRQVLHESDPKLLVWPETALPDFLFRHPSWTDSVRVLARIEGTPILFGMVDLIWPSPNKYEYFNAAALADSTGALGAQVAYHKEYLVPIVERVPFINPNWFAALEYFGAFSRGHDQVPFQLPFGKIGVLICYESVFPQLSRYYRRHGADLIVNITNDAWFGRSSAPHQHLAHLALRAIENRVGILRSANTGISGYIDPLGQPHGMTDLFVSAARTYTPETTSVRTLYVIAGDWIGTLCIAATLAMVAAYWRRVRAENEGEGA